MNDLTSVPDYVSYEESSIQNFYKVLSHVLIVNVPTDKGESAIFLLVIYRLIGFI